jgi:hypothetical protein
VLLAKVTPRMRREHSTYGTRRLDRQARAADHPSEKKLIKENSSMMLANAAAIARIAIPHRVSIHMGNGAGGSGAVGAGSSCERMIVVVFGRVRRTLRGACARMPPRCARQQAGEPLRAMKRFTVSRRRRSRRDVRRIRVFILMCGTVPIIMLTITDLSRRARGTFQIASRSALLAEGPCRHSLWSRSAVDRTRARRWRTHWCAPAPT